jgi:hypothetical protein
MSTVLVIVCLIYLIWLGILTKVIRYEIYDGGFWFRIFGYGLTILDSHKYYPLFSERMGYRRYLYIGKWKIRHLTPYEL